MTIRSIPVGIRRFARLQSSLLAIRSQHTITIIFQKHLHIQVARHPSRHYAQQSNHQLFLHFLIIFLIKFLLKVYISVDYSTLIINVNTQNSSSSKVGMFRISNLKTIRCLFPLNIALVTQQLYRPDF